MLPAQRGDALWLTYGTAEKKHHVLIDAGPSNTIDEVVPELEKRIAALPGRKNRVELFIVTHIDADHIQGVVSLLSDPARVPLFRDVWFNGWKHVSEVLGGVDAERLTASLAQHPDHWNAAFDGHGVRIEDEGDLPVVRARGRHDRHGHRARARGTAPTRSGVGQGGPQGRTHPRRGCTDHAQELDARTRCWVASIPTFSPSRSSHPTRASPMSRASR